VAFGPLLRSTMMASPIGMVLAAGSNQLRTWGILAASRMTAISPEAMSRTPLDRQVRIGLPAIVPGGNPEACGSRAGRKEKSCADENDAHGGQSGERVSDVCAKHGFPSTFWHPEKARRQTRPSGSPGSSHICHSGRDRSRRTRRNCSAAQLVTGPDQCNAGFGGNATEMPFCAPPTDRTEGIVPVQIGGYRRGRLDLSGYSP
jgi:hypothetical protein